MRKKKPLTLQKKSIDERLNVFTDIGYSEIRLITGAFLNEIMKGLLEGKEVHLPGFGTFRVTKSKGSSKKKVTLTKGTWKPGETAGTMTIPVPEKYLVHFRRAAAFKDKFKELRRANNRRKEMDKLGVDTSVDDQEKIASEGCPVCGTKPVRHGNVIACPVHGTEPFEAKPKTPDK